MQWTDDIRIETPEQIDVSLEIAGLGSRFVAWVVDWLCKAVGALVLLLLGLILAGLGGIDPGNAKMFLVALSGVTFFWWLGYDITFEVRRNGQTPGKKTAGIRVIREWGAPVDFRSACIRNLLALADFLPPVYVLGGVLVLLSARGQRLGDMAAGTIVIRERAPEPPGDPVEAIQRLALDEFLFTAEQLAVCQPDDRNVLRAFFKRYPKLEPKPRHQLALRLAEEFRRKTGYQPLEPLTVGKRSKGFLAALFRDLEKVAAQGKGNVE
jgi:uncharacterized RDD family membrane protein YckC